MNAKPAQLPTPPEIPRADFGRASVLFGEKNGKYPNANMLIVHGREARAALDAPLVSNVIGPEFDGVDLVLMGHIHEDHMCGLHRVPHAAVHVHEADLAAARSWAGMVAAYGVGDPALEASMLERYRRDFTYAPRPDTIGFADGATWDLGGTTVRAIHAPGHTAGHCVLLVEPEGVAFIGDIDLTGFGPYYGDASSSLSGFRRSLAMLPDIPAKVWVTAHHRGVYTDRDVFLRDLAAYAAKLDERNDKLLAMLEGAPQTLEQLVARRLIYPPGYESEWANSAETRSISQHLAELAAAGRVVGDGGMWRRGCELPLVSSVRLISNTGD